MRSRNKRLRILLDAEVQDLYGPPTLTLEQKRAIFLLNDIEREALDLYRGQYLKAYFILLLGYFKVKPIILNLNFAKIREDFQFILQAHSLRAPLGPRNLTSSQKS